jgi:hypothetical protein
MSTQPFSSLESTTQKPFAIDDTEEHRKEFKSALDGPWKVRVLPEGPELPPGVSPQPADIGPSGGPVKWLPAPEAQVAKSLPWRKGDVTRLKDDSPEGMMRYIATHTSGWWQEMAERALRDTEKARRMAEEAGWQPGQYWSVEVDAEAKQKLLEAEEARRAREEAERAKEEAEKEAFARRQMELLKKADKAPRCEYVYSDGRGCRAPQVKGERWCHGHAKTMSYRPEKLEMLPMEDEKAVMVNLYRVTKSLLAGRISEKTAGLMLWSVAIGMPAARRMRKSPRSRVIADIARDRKLKTKEGKHLPQMNADERGSNGKPKTFQTRRITPTRQQLARRGPLRNGVSGGKEGKHLPQMNADERRSNKKQLAHSNRRLAKANPKTCETRTITPAGQPRAVRGPRRRNGVSGGKEGKHLPQMNADERGSGGTISRESTGMKTLALINAIEGGLEQGCASRNLDGSTSRNTGASLTMTSGSAANDARRGSVNPGVTGRKSFKSGVAGRVPRARLKDSGTRANSLNRHGHGRHSRDLSTPPHAPSQAQGRSESLKMTRGGDCGRTSNGWKNGKCVAEKGASGDRVNGRSSTEDGVIERIGSSGHRQIGSSGHRKIQGASGKIASWQGRE